MLDKAAVSYVSLAAGEADDDVVKETYNEEDNQMNDISQEGLDQSEYAEDEVEIERADTHLSRRGGLLRLHHLLRYRSSQSLAKGIRTLIRPLSRRIAISIEERVDKVHQRIRIRFKSACYCMYLKRLQVGSVQKESNKCHVASVESLVMVDTISHLFFVLLSACDSRRRYCMYKLYHLHVLNDMFIFKDCDLCAEPKRRCFVHVSSFTSAG